MEQIVQRIAGEFAKKITTYYAENGIGELGKMADNVLEITNETAKELLRAFISDADSALITLKRDRKQDGITVHERSIPRSVFTSLGEFTYERTYFKTPLGMSYILDDILGVAAYDRVDTHVSAKLVEEAGRGSFGRSAVTVTGGAVTRQTAWRKSAEIGEVATMPKRLEQSPKSIHIFADEDHAHLQSGKDAIVPLVTVCTGKRSVCKGRNELIDKIHLPGYKMKAETLWEYVYAVCDSKYDMNSVRDVFIYGDGASWIDASEECFPGAVRVLDAYHCEKGVKRLSAGSVGKKFAPSLRAAVKRGDKEGFFELCELMKTELRESISDEKERETRIESISKASNYLLTRWDAVVNMRHPNSIGSCTEPMISHVLSERLSRNPMGWSEDGLSGMTRIRVYQENGGKISPCDIGLRKKKKGEKRTALPFIKKYDDLVRRQQEEIFSGTKDWRLFEHEYVEAVSPSGTKVALDALARLRCIA